MIQTQNYNLSAYAELAKMLCTIKVWVKTFQRIAVSWSSNFDYVKIGCATGRFSDTKTASFVVARKRRNPSAFKLIKFSKNLSLIATSETPYKSEIIEIWGHCSLLQCIIRLIKILAENPLQDKFSAETLE